jgi:hypothetical protein
MGDLAVLDAKIASTGRKVANVLKGQQALCQRPVDRLAALCTALAGVDVRQREHAGKRFADAVAVYRKAIAWQVHYPWPLYWIATGQRLASQVHDVHTRIDAVYAELEVLGVTERSDLRDGWRANWKDEYGDMVRWLDKTARQNDATHLRTQAKDNPFKIRECLATIKLQLNVYGDQDQVMEDADESMGEADEDMGRSGLDVTPEMFALMKSTLEKLIVDPNVDPAGIYAWYITKEDVTYDRDSAFAEGSFGVLYKGTWVGSDEAVGVKILDETGDNGAAFSREFSTWWPLRHPNILEMYGANHVAEHRFFVCELASENFISFFQDGGNRHLLWTKFGQAAEGLAFLHANLVQHGGIKINNLLVAADGTVKLSDLGLSVVRDQSKTMSNRPKEQGTRWMAPEEVTDEEVRIQPLQADIYSLGLCIIEVVTGKLIFPDMDDKEVYDRKRAHELVERPDGAFSDEEWALVSRMVENDPERRPTAAELVQLMSGLVPP